MDREQGHASGEHTHARFNKLRLILQVMDMDGNENNELEVKKGKSDSGSQDSLDSWEKVDIPSEEELERHSRSMFKAQASTLQLTLEAELPPPLFR